MSTLITKTFNTHQIRIVELNGQPWFVAADVCRTLNMALMANGQPNVTMATRGLISDERSSAVVGHHNTARRVTIINESGLYKLIMRSDKPEARAAFPSPE